MREILFKAKRIDNGEWVEGCLLVLDDETYRIATSCLQGNEEHLLQVCAYEVDPSTICQCTWLKDKNGKLIWENDIVRYKDDLANMVKEDLVKWNETHASFTRLHKSQMGLQYLLIDECIANGCEVICNIFDEGSKSLYGE